MQGGIPLNLADGSSDFSGIDPLETRYIEVYRGANELQFGASNLASAINFISPTGYNSPEFEVLTELGIFGYNRLCIATGDEIDNLDFLALLPMAKIVFDMMRINPPCALMPILASKLMTILECGFITAM